MPCSSAADESRRESSTRMASSSPASSTAAAAIRPMEVAESLSLSSPVPAAATALAGAAVGLWVAKVGDAVPPTKVWNEAETIVTVEVIKVTVVPLSPLIVSAMSRAVADETSWLNEICVRIEPVDRVHWLTSAAVMRSPETETASSLVRSQRVSCSSDDSSTMLPVYVTVTE